jgi:hypothetical protein
MWAVSNETPTKWGTVLIPNCITQSSVVSLLSISYGKRILSVYGVSKIALQLWKLVYIYPEDMNSVFNCHNVAKHTKFDLGRLQWPSGLRHELFSPAPTLRSWVRIPLKHGCLCLFCVRFSCFYIVSSETARRPIKRLMRNYHWIKASSCHMHKSAN